MLNLFDVWNTDVDTVIFGQCQIWGDDSYFNARGMDVYITKLGKYFNADDYLQFLQFMAQVSNW